MCPFRWLRVERQNYSKLATTHLYRRLGIFLGGHAGECGGSYRPSANKNSMAAYNPITAIRVSDVERTQCGRSCHSILGFHLYTSLFCLLNILFIQTIELSKIHDSVITSPLPNPSPGGRRARLPSPYGGGIEGGGESVANYGTSIGSR